MNFVRGMAVCSLILALGSASADDTAQKKKKPNTLKGVVESVHQDKNPNNKELGTLTLKVQNKKDNTAQETKIHVTKDTKIEKVSGKKGQKQHAAADFAALHKGEHLIVHTRVGHPHE